MVGVLTLGSLMLFATKSVRVKLLPFDNKSEIQVIFDMPRGTTLEDTERALMEGARRLQDIPELVSIQAYAGTAAPFNFNGLVRHYYLRENPEQGDLAINLQPKEQRKRESHAIALDVREKLKGLALPPHASVKVVEVPPGPPVLATLAGRGLWPGCRNARRMLATTVKEAFRKVDFVVDADDSFGIRTERLRFAIDQEALEFHGVQEQAVYDTLGALMGGVKIGYSQRGKGLKPIDITLALPRSSLTPVGKASLHAPARRWHGPSGHQCRAWRCGEGDA